MVVEFSAPGSLIKKVLEAITNNLGFARVNFSSTDISFHASGGVVTVWLLLKTKKFDFYFCNTNTSLWVDMVNVADVIDLAEDDDIVYIKGDEGSDTITIKFSNQSPEKEKFGCFEAGLMDMEAMNAYRDYVSFLVPGWEYGATVKMHSADLAKIGNNFMSICPGIPNPIVVISVTNEGITFSSKGEEDRFGLAKTVCKQNPSVGRVIQMHDPEPMTLSFNLRFVYQITKAAPLSNQVSISLCNQPGHAMFEYYIGDDIGDVRFYLSVFGGTTELE